MFIKHKAFFVSTAIYLLIAAALMVGSVYLCKGQFIFALDDPYIHMSMAKNFVTHGAWATNNMAFTSASSSPLWVLIISGAYCLAGIGTAVPFILNVLFQMLTIYIAYRILKSYNIQKFQLTFLLAFIFITPFFTLLFTGMEHSAQICSALLFAFLSVQLISSDEKDNNALKYIIFVTPLVSAIRYEGMFLVTVISLLLLLRKKFSYSALIFALGLLPVVIYGIISVSNGWYFIPNTILLKSTPHGYSLFDILRFFYKAFKNITQPHIFLTLMICTFLYALNYKRDKRLWSSKQVFLLIAVLTAILNMGMIEFHNNGWFYRYDAYVMALGIIAISINLYDYLPDITAFIREKKSAVIKGGALILLLVLLSPFVIRAFTVFEVPFATKNIYDQHYQMSQFVVKYATGFNVAANDIGMIDFYSGSGVLDLYGLTSMEVARAKLTKSYTTQLIAELTNSRNVKLAIVYAEGYGAYGGLPASWVKLGTWTMTEYNIVCGYETVTFFSLNPEDADNFRNELKEYSEHLPKSVAYKIF